MDQNAKQNWVDTLAEMSNDFGQVSDLNDSVEPSYCALGVLAKIMGDDKTKYAYKPTIRSRIRNLRERVGYWVGSKIAGFDIKPYSDYYDHY